MKYNMMILPPDYEGNKLSNHPSCVMCGEQLELIDEFLNVKSLPDMSTDFESLFSLCQGCGMPHLELVSGDVDFLGPVLIAW
ncbi:hypothetical protein [Cytobacillus oceanisediminis]|uniref:hypothetical protein n=1 Tax=Cytobacillus oceanisediminis TaxID=665099 RepID=UPI001FB2DE34|nr:hypothetical protein [Cytobacillus oceanisediminis]UOE58127.1 hypothetical protein IRB79_26840 [Cytobacillus oceanisediminis]